MYSLTMALQHELGITALSWSFGPATMAKLEAHGPVSSSSKKNLIYIAQCAFFCKGYDAGDINGEWGNRTIGVSTDLAVYMMMDEMGLAASRDNTIKPKVFKALLTLDAYKLLNGGNSEVRKIQQWLNANYWGKSFGAVIPCDGIYSRDVQQSLMKAIQSASGIEDASVNGQFGPRTREGLRQHPLAPGDVGLWVQFLSAACVFNGDIVVNGTPTRTVFRDQFVEALSNYLKDFQNFNQVSGLGSSGHGKADYDTWCQLLVSTGNPDRATAGCDTRFTISSGMAKALKASGYNVIGRYLSNDPNGWDKCIKPGELESIFDAGLRVLPIFQLNARQLSDFTYSTGYSHGQEAHDRITYYNFTNGPTVYFAVDYDATDNEITSNIIPYFRGVQAAALKNGRSYRTGVYGSRNVCSRVSKETSTSSSFVSGMSWGFSGNLGYALPSNWAFNQIKEFSYTGAGETIDLDNDVHRPAVDPGVGRADVGGPSTSPATVMLDFIDKVHAAAVTYGGANPSVRVMEYLRHPQYTGEYQGWTLLLGPADQKWLDYANARFGERGATQLRYSDPLYGETVNIDHLAATASAVVLKGSGVGAGIKRGDFGGWSGDLTTFYCDWFNRRTSYTSAYAFALDNLAIRGKASSWSFGDMIEDVDGYLVGTAVTGGATFATALRTHLTGTGKNTRFRTFFQKRYGSSWTTVGNAAMTMLSGDLQDSTLAAFREGFYAQAGVLFPQSSDRSLADGYVARLKQLVANG